MINLNIYIPKKLSGLELIEYKKTLHLTDLQRECIIGTLLGDASIADPMKDTVNPGIKWEQSIKYQEYIYHIYEIMKPWVGTPPLVRNITGGGAKDRQSIWFKTYRHPSFRFYMDQFYIRDLENDGKRRKCVPKLIHRWLTPRALAYWFMDDGTRTSDGHYILHTHCFPLHEQQRLVQVLGELYNLEVSIHKDKGRYRLYIKSKSIDKFAELVSPYSLKCMSHKFHPSVFDSSLIPELKD